MNWLPYVILGFISAILLFQFYIWYRMRKLHGQPVEGLTEIPGAPENAESCRLILYFFSLQCAHCRTMSKVIDSLQKETGNIIKINTMENMELARKLGISGVPSVLVVDNGAITKVLLGVQPRQRLEKLLTTCCDGVESRTPSAPLNRNKSEP